MSVPSTRERQKIPVSQITRGPNTARLSCSCNAITIRESISKRRARIFQWAEHNERDSGSKALKAYRVLPFRLARSITKKRPHGRHSTF